MKTASISQLKAQLSAYIDRVRQGDEVVITDRGRAVARLTAIDARGDGDPRRDLLVRSGQLRLPQQRLPADFWNRARPSDRGGRSLAALLEERDESR